MENEQPLWEFHKRRLFSEYDKYMWPVHMIARCTKCGHEENADDWFVDQKQMDKCQNCGAEIIKEGLDDKL